MANPKPGSSKDGTSMPKMTPPSSAIEPGVSVKLGTASTSKGRKSLR